MADSGGPDSQLRKPGPSDYRDPATWSEMRRITVWLVMGVTLALIILLINPILWVLAAIVIAAMLDGGTRLLGRVLPIGRGWRLLLVILLVTAFLLWTFYLTGSELIAQASQLPSLIQVQVDRASAWLEGHGVNLGIADLRSAAEQLMGSIGRVTAAVGSAIGVFSSLVLMLVLAIFFAAEPGVYARGSAWLLPIHKREAALSLLDKMGSALRRLMAGRLVGMAVEGVGTWLLLLVGGVPMAALLGVLTGILAFLPNIGAIISGALIILVGFSAGTEIGIYAVVVYLAVQMIDGYLIVPMVARRAVDLPPALVLAAQILFGTLFGILGLFLADSVLAMAKVFLEERAQRRERDAHGRNIEAEAA